MDPEVTQLTSSEHAGLQNSFSDRVALLLTRIDCKRAVSGELREEIFRLRYRAYMREGTIYSNSSGTVSDPYDDTENGFVFGLYIDQELASSIRIHVGSRKHPNFPSLEVFPDVLQPELDANKVIVDTTYFVTDENLSRRHRELPYATLRISWLAARYFSADHFLAAARAEHQAVYRRAFHHRLISGPRPDPRLARPISLMTTHYATVADRVHRRYRFFRSTFFERRLLFECAPPMPGTFRLRA